MAAKTYSIEPGIAELIVLALDKDRVGPMWDKWRDDVASGVIDDRARAVFIAMGWITSRDVRVTPIRPGVLKEPRRVKEPSVAEE